MKSPDRQPQKIVCLSEKSWKMKQIFEFGHSSASYGLCLIEQHTDFPNYRFFVNGES